MLAVLSLRRKALAWTAALLAMLALQACNGPFPSGGTGLNFGGSAKVALLVPKSSQNGASLAQSLENAARLAVQDLGDRTVVEFVEFASPEPGVLEPVFEMAGFTRVADAMIDQGVI